MFKLYFGNNIAALVFLPLIIGVYYVNFFLFGDPGTSLELSFGFFGKKSGADPFLFGLLGVVIVFVNAILINRIFNRNDFMEKNNFLTALLYVVCYSFFHSFYFLDGLSIAHFLIVLMLYQLFALKQNEDARRTVFNAALLFSMACTFYPVLTVATPVLFSIIWIFRPVIIREAALLISGLVVPLIYVWLYGYLFNIEVTVEELSSSIPKKIELEIVISGMMALVLLLFAAPMVIKKISASSIRLKKLFKMLLLLLGMTLVAGAIEVGYYYKIGGASLLIIPMIFFLSYAFGKKNIRVLPVAIFYLFYLFSIGKFFVPIQLSGI